MTRPYALSPSGRRVAVLADDALLTGELRTGPDAPTPLPELDPPIPAEEINLPRTTLAFVGESTVLVRRYEPYQGQVYRCDAFDLETRSWSERGAECIHGEMLEVYRVIGGPGGLVSIFSVGEGHPAFTVARLTPEGQREVPTRPEVSLYPFALVLATFAADEPALWLTAACPLERDGEVMHPCLTDDGVDVDEAESPWSLYVWREGSPELTPIARDLPPFTVAAPDGERLAWPRGRCACLGDRGGVERRCVEVPGVEES